MTQSQSASARRSMPILRDAPVCPVPYPAQNWRRGQHGDWVRPRDAAQNMAVDVRSGEVIAVWQEESNVCQQFALGEPKTGPEPWVLKRRNFKSILAQGGCPALYPVGAKSARGVIQQPACCRFSPRDVTWFAQCHASKIAHKPHVRCTPALTGGARSLPSGGIKEAKPIFPAVR
jgi:hypothetical protein